MYQSSSQTLTCGLAIVILTCRLWATVCKTVCPMLSDRCLFSLTCPVCDVGVLWPNGWRDQDGTWHAGRPRPWPHCVRWRPRSPFQKGGRAPLQFSAHICCGQMARWIKMPLFRKVGLDPSDIVLDGDPATPTRKETEPPIFGPYLLWPNGCMDQDATWYDGR